MSYLYRIILKIKKRRNEVVSKLIKKFLSFLFNIFIRLHIHNDLFPPDSVLILLCIRANFSCTEFRAVWGPSHRTSWTEKGYPGSAVFSPAFLFFDLKVPRTRQQIYICQSSKMFCPG